MYIGCTLKVDTKTIDDLGCSIRVVGLVPIINYANINEMTR